MSSLELHVLTANRLIDGVVVYLGADNHWVERLDDARVVSSDVSEADLLPGGAKGVRDRAVVGPYLFAVARSANALHPLSQRERIRADGPSIAFAPAKTSSGN